MVKLNVTKLLLKKGKNKYWLFNELNKYKMVSYTNFNNLVEQKTSSIKYENIEILCKILDCTVNELITIGD